MTAAPGSKNYSSFSALCQTVYRVQERIKLKPGSFFPAPGVRSSVVVLEPKQEVELVREWDFFLRCLRVLFSSRRKTMRNNLSAAAIIPRNRVDRLNRVFQEAGVDPQARSETLSPERLLRLSNRLAVELEDL